ncbi:MAG: AI-2E family transporter [Acidiferrobacterales bacterium]
MIEFFQKPAFRTGLILFLIAVPIVFLAWLLQTIMLPIVVASVMYVLLDPAVNLLRQRGINKTLAITIVLVLVIGVVAWFIVTMVPLLAEQFASFRQRLPQAWDNLSQLLQRAELWLTEVAGVTIDRGGLLQTASNAMRGASGKLIGHASSAVKDLALWIMLIPLFSFFFLRDFKSLRNGILGWIPNNLFERSLLIYHKVTNQLKLYVRGVMLQSLIMAIVTSIGFTIIGLPLAILLGVLAGIFNLIPYVGPLLAMVAPVLVTLSMGMDPTLLIAAVSVILAGQLVDNLVVVPTVLARAANLHPLMALLAIIVAGNLFGLAGMVFALPVAATARIIFVGVYEELARAA